MEPKKIDLYETITNKILDKLEKGEVPWHKPWDSSVGIPRNLINNKPYNGINSMILGCQRYDSPYWLTFKQCSEKGGKVKKGEKGSIIVFWTFLDKNTGKPVAQDADHEGDKLGSKDIIPYLKYYTVFNTNQCENLNVKQIAAENPEIPIITSADAIVKGMPNPPEIKEGFTRACYYPIRDELNMPRIEAFKTTEEYYSTLFHELTHSTGHEKRLHRRNSTEARSFGDEKYSKEELVAEMGAAFLCAKSGIGNVTIDNSAAYIQSWMKALKDDKKLLITAAGQAQKAVNYITNNLEQTATISKPEPAIEMKKAVGMER